MAERGEDVVIARAGKPVARLTSLTPEKKPVIFGLMKGQIWVADDFDDLLPPDALADSSQICEIVAGHAHSHLADGRQYPPERGGSETDHWRAGSLCIVGKRLGDCDQGAARETED